MSYNTIIYEQQGAVAIVTLDRQDRMNAYTHEMRDEMMQAIGQCNDNPDIGAIIFTGGGRAFCAGADVEQMFKAKLDGGAEDTPAPRKVKSNDWVPLLRKSKPLIAAVNGAAVGVGLTMILPFDYIIASEKAKFCCAFAKMGVVTELASSHYLVQRMGFGRASEAALSARMILAEEAVSLGLADKLVAADDLMESALETANAMAANPDSSLRAIKELLTLNGSETDLNQVMEREFAALDIAYTTPAHKEAVAAFMEKRPPQFRR